MEIVNGKHFSITDPQEVSTVIYRINKSDKSLEDFAPKYTIERLLYSEELKGDLKKKTFLLIVQKKRGNNSSFYLLEKKKLLLIWVY